MWKWNLNHEINLIYLNKAWDTILATTFYTTCWAVVWWFVKNKGSINGGLIWYWLLTFTTYHFNKLWKSCGKVMSIGGLYLFPLEGRK